MLRINRDGKCFYEVEKLSLSQASILERNDLQEFICNSPDLFFAELGQSLFFLGKEVVPSTTISDRIDILALDREGNCVIVELKRGNHKLQMLQSISYAAMISQWTPDDFLNLLDPQKQELLYEFLYCEKESINRRQRILLVAESYDYALLVSAEWLSERFGMDITCCRISVAKDSSSGTEFLVCSNVFPAPELASVAIARGRSSVNPKVQWSNWSMALVSVTNPNVKRFFESEHLSVSNDLNRRTLRYKVLGKLRFYVLAKTDRAYIWQSGRFEGDVDHWKRGLSEQANVEPVKNGTCLRMYFREESDFIYFKRSITEFLATTHWENENARNIEQDLG